MSNLSQNQLRVLDLFTLHEPLKVADVVAYLKLPRPTAKQILSKLVSLHLVRRHGQGRSAAYSMRSEDEVIGTHGQKLIVVHRGEDALEKMLGDVTRRLGKDDLYWSFAFKDEYQQERVVNLLRELHRKLEIKKVDDRSIVHEEARENVTSTYRRNKNLRLRFTKHSVPLGTVILRDRVINLTWGKQPIAVEVRSTAIQKSYSDFFLSEWENAVSIPGQQHAIVKPGNTRIISDHEIFGVKNLFIKDETSNPTHTFKDRLAYEMVRPQLESILAGKKPHPMTFGSISYGNTAKAMGYYVAALNKLHGKEVARAVAFIPPKMVGRTFGPDTSGARVTFKTIKRDLQKTVRVVPLDLSKKIYRPKDLEELARRHKAVVGDFVDITEGLNRPAYVNIIIESIEQQFKASPDYVVVPFGAGILANEIIDYVEEHALHTKVIPVSSGNPDTIAVMLYGPIWVDTKALRLKGKGLTRHEPLDRKGHPRKPYLVYHVRDAEIRRAMRELARIGVTAEPSGASGIAILPRLKKIDPDFDPKKHSVLVINTGDGLLNYNHEKHDR